MLVSCPSCQAKYNIDDARIPASGLKLKCPKCTTVFPVQKGGDAGGGVPLPGGAPGAGPPPGAGGVPLRGGAPPAGPPPGAGVPLPGGAPAAGPPPGAGVPLPGGAPPAGAPPAGPPPGAGVPLPGGAPPAGPPPGAGVPLPGGAPAAGPPPGAGVPLPGGAPPAGPPPGAGVPLPGGAPAAAPPPGAGVPLPGSPAGGLDYGSVDLPGADDGGSTRVYAAPPTMPDFGNVDLGGGDAPVPVPAPAPPAGGFDPFADVAVQPSAPAAPAPPVAPPPAAAPAAPPAAPPPGDDLSFDPTAAPAPAAPPLDDDLSFDPTAAPAPAGDGLELDPTAAPAPAPAPAAGGGDDLEILDFIDNEYEAAKAGGSKVREAGPDRYRVRRKSGKTFGPFEPEVVVTMLREGQLLGNEEVSTDGKSWKPIGSVPQFAEAIQALMEAPSLGVDSPMMPTMPDGADDLDDTDTVAPKGRGYGVYGMSGASSATSARANPKKLLLAKLKKRWPLFTGLILLVGLVGFGVYLGFTPYGYFAYKLVFTPGAGGHNKPTRELLGDARKGIDADTYAGYTEALDSAKAALRANGDDVEAQSLFCQAAFYLQRLYGNESGAVKRALGYMHDLAVTSKSYPPYLKAKMDLALLKGNEATARPALVQYAKTHPKDLEALYVLGASYFRAHDAKHAAAYIDKILVADPNNAKAFHAEGFIQTMVKGPNARPTAIAYFKKALAADPKHLSSALELAQLYLVNDDPNLTAGENALDRVSGAAFKTLAPTERARADYLRGVLDSLKGQVEDAQTAFKKGVALGPNSAFGRTAYGEFLLKRRSYAKAADELGVAAKLSKDDVRVNGLHVEALIRAGRALDATQALDDLKARAPRKARVIFLEGLLAHSKGDDDVAERYYAKATKANDHFYRAALALGNLYLEERRVKEAGPVMHAAVKGGPRAAETHVGLGQFLLADHRAPEAEAAFDAALKLQPDDAGAHLGLARAYAQMGKNDQAKAEFEKVRQINKAFPDLEFYYGTWLWKQGQTQAAAVALKKAHAQAPKDPAVQARYGAVLYDLGQIDEAGQQLVAATNEGGNLGEAFYYLGLVYAKQGDLRSAENRMQTAIHLEPENSRYRFALGQLNEQDNDLSAALRGYKSAVKIDNQYIDAWVKIGEVDDMLNDYGRAVKAFKSALKIDPQRADILTQVGDTYSRTSKLKKAIRWYERALKAKEGDTKPVYYKLARAQDDSGDKKDAERNYLEALKVQPSNAKPHYYLGYLYKDQRRKKEAIASFQAYLKATPKTDPRYSEVSDEIYDLQHQ